MYDIFLSYSTEDRGRLVPLVAALEQQGWSVFWDHRSIPIGKDWRDVIEEEVCQCHCILVVWSQESIKSKWVKEEASEGSSRKVLLPIRIDNVLPPFGFRETQTGNFIDWNGKMDYPEFIRLAGQIRLLLGQDDVQAKREAADAAERERLGKEKAAAEQQAREDAEQQRRLAEEARIRRETAEAAERERLAKEKKLAQQRAAEQQAREEAERQAKAREEQLKREQAAAEEKARKEAARQAKASQNPPSKRFPLIPALLISAAVLGVGGYVWQSTNKSSVGASPAGDSPTPQINPVKEESLAGQAPTAAPQTDSGKKPFEPEMVAIDGGTFTMGCDGKRDDVEGGCYDSEKPAHKVTIDAFSLAKTETTVGQYMACVDAGACPQPEWQEKGSEYNIKTGTNDLYKKLGNALTDPNYPIVGVSWDNANAYAKWLSKETGKNYRLPTEAEWEYAARGGTDGAYPWGNSIGKGNANCYKDQCGDKFEYTAPVGSFAANGYGLQDMNGNVWEWVLDTWHSDYKGAPADGSAWESGDKGVPRVLRGGSLHDIARYVRSARRSNSAPDDRFNGNGFRLALGSI